jgi:hypothetical protein
MPTPVTAMAAPANLRSVDTAAAMKKSRCVEYGVPARKMAV